MKDPFGGMHWMLVTPFFENEELDLDSVGPGGGEGPLPRAAWGWWSWAKWGSGAGCWTMSVPLFWSG